jgi:hypothetical protein
VGFTIVKNIQGPGVRRRVKERSQTVTPVNPDSIFTIVKTIKGSVTGSDTVSKVRLRGCGDDM